MVVGETLTYITEVGGDTDLYHGSKVRLPSVWGRAARRARGAALSGSGTSSPAYARLVTAPLKKINHSTQYQSR